MLETSVHAPSQPEQRAALREQVLAAAAETLEAVRAAGLTLPRSTSAGAKPAKTALQVRAVHGGALAPVVSQERARELFARIASSPDIPHAFVDEGCHLRAH